MALVFLLVLLGLLFVLGFSTGRRFGVLGLALAAGALLSTYWAGTVTPFIQEQGIVLNSPPLRLVVQVALVILPPLVLLFSGPAYKSMWPRVGGALAFALLAFALLTPEIGAILQLDTLGLGFYGFFDDYRSIIIALGIIGAVADMLLLARPKGKKRAEH